MKAEILKSFNRILSYIEKPNQKQLEDEAEKLRIDLNTAKARVVKNPYAIYLVRNDKLKEHVGLFQDKKAAENYVSNQVEKDDLKISTHFIEVEDD